MFKKFNMFALALLIIGQTILGPIGGVGVAFADESEAISEPVLQSVEETTEVNEPTQAETEVVEPETPTEQPKDEDSTADGEVEVDKNQTDTDGPSEDEGTIIPDKSESGDEEIDDPKPESSIGGKENNEDLTEETNEESLPGHTLFNTNSPQEITGATLTGFKMTVNGEEVGAGAFSDELAQDTTAKFDVKFSVPMQDDQGEAWGDGSWFEFPLPNSLIDYDSAFKGTKTVGDITYNYSTTGNKVRVELSGMPVGSGSAQPETLEITFTSGFNFESADDKLEQDIVIPSVGSDTINATFTFKPTTSNEKVKKSSTGTPTPGADGNHVMQWEVWVNEAGKLLSGAELADNPTGGHAIVDGSVNVYQYTVGLKGVQNKAGTGTQVLTNGNWLAVNATLTDRNAYKITYETVVNLNPEERDGPKTFNNTVTFTNDNQPNETSSNASHTVTYGKALEKHNSTTSGNYTKEWRIDYNHNLLSIPRAEASLTDTITGPHEIDFSTIKVYKMNDANGNVATTVPTTGELTTGFTISPNTGSGKTFTITFDNTITDAYTVVYESKYTAKDFLEENAITGELKNTVTNGANKSDSGTYSLTENLLEKKAAVNVNAKTITWTINIKSDNPNKEISNLTLTDVFNSTKDGEAVDGTHKLVGDITITGITGTAPIISNDHETTTGFTITGINIAAGGTATVTYTTSFDIGDAGQVAAQGYGNKATTKWTSGSDTYTKTDTAEYIPQETTLNNGSKSGDFNYSTREFTWDVKVNINKKDIGGAVLVDTVGDGHKYVPGTIEVLPLTLPTSGDDTGGTIGTTAISADNYTISDETDKGFTLTFKPTAELGIDINENAYVVRYKTVDEDNIIGIGSTTPMDKGNIYTNGATFQTKGTQTYTLGSTPVTLDDNVANNLITKRNPSQDSAKEKITWTLDVNKSHSDLGTNVELTDVPGDQLWLLEESIQIATYNVTVGGVSENTDWQTPAQRNIPISFGTDGGFTLTFPSLENIGYQVKYETIGFGESGDALTNTATLNYSGATAENQQKQDAYNGSFSFSASDSSFTTTRGSAKFKKVGIDSSTGEVKDTELPGVTFQLVKKTTNNEYIIKTATTDADGELIFENVPYNDYLVREVAAPTDYAKMDDFAFTLDATTTLDQNPSLVTTLVNTTPLAGSCDTFIITVKDVDGEAITSGKVTLTDSNGKETEVIVEADGTVKLEKNFPAGKYTVKHDGEGELGEVTVQYGNCNDEVQPAPSCDTFTIAVKDGDEIRTDIAELTLKQGTTEVKVTPTADGKFIVDSNGKDPTNGVKPGTYSVYEDQQYLGEVTLTYKEDCGHQFVVTQAPTCPTFTLTVKGVDGDPREEDVEVTIKVKGDDTASVITTKTDANGQVSLDDLKPNVYEVYEGNILLGEFTTNTECEGFVQPAPACDVFIFEFKDADGKPKKNTEITLENVETKEKYTYTTNEDGMFNTEAKIPAGEYNVYEGELFHGKETISYIDMDCNTDQPAITISDNPSCETFTLTVNDRNGNPREGVTVVVKDSKDKYVTNGIDPNGDPITQFTTNGDGQVEYPEHVVKQGTYTVYEVNANGTEKEINSFTVTDKCFEEVKPKSTGGGGGWVPPTPNTCDIFTITVKQNGTTVGANVELTFKSGTTEVKGSTNVDGKIVINENNLPVGKYTAYDKDGKEVGSINVSYDQDKCQDEIDLLVKACDVFTVTVKQSDKTVGAGTSVTLKDADGKTVTTGTTNKDGQITFNKDDLTAGSYTAYDKDGKKIGDIKVAYDGNCEAELNLPAPSCDVFTITVKKSGETVKAGTILSLKDAIGKTVVTGTTNANGQIVFDKTALPTGTYTAVDQDGKEIAKVTVSYDEGKCQAVVDILLKACEHFNLTVVDTPNKTVQIKDKDGNIVATGKTDANGKVIFTQSIPEGNYDVYIDGKKVASLPVTDSCEETVTPQEDPEKPVDPEKPTPEKPDPDNPGNDGSNKPDGDNGSNTPGGNKPDSNKPGTNGNASTPGSKLPQTGEEQFLYMIVLGSLLIIGGGAMFIAQRRKEN